MGRVSSKIYKKENKLMSKDNENSVYIFHNIKHNIFLFTNCENYENAMDIFNLSGFDDREQWKIFVKCGEQPNIRNMQYENR